MKVLENGCSFRYFILAMDLYSENSAESADVG